MYLFLIVYEEVLEGEVTSLVERLRIERYIKWDEVKGEWKEKHMGTHVWPGEYHSILTMVEEGEATRLKEEIRKLRQRFPADEIWGWMVPLEEVI